MAFSKMLRRRYDAMLAERRKQQMLVDWQILPSEDEMSWMTEEERNIVEWFDRHEYEIFMDRARHPRGGWIVRFCQYVCLVENRVQEKFGFYLRNMLDPVLDKIVSAAESGNGRAQYSLGFLYERGGYYSAKKKLPWDISLAWDWYRKSAESGCIQGQKAYAHILQGGRCWKQLIGMDLRELERAPDNVKDALDLNENEIRDKCFQLQAEDLRESLKWCRIIAEHGDIQMCYDLACQLVVGDAGVQDIEEGVKWLQIAAKAGFPKAVSVVSAAEGDMSAVRIAAELHISLLVEKSKKQKQGCGGSLEFSLDVPSEGVNAEFGDDWLRANSPDGVVVPPPSGRNTARTPNLKSANPSFAALLIGYIRDTFGGDAPTVYRAAHVSRKTYSAIISNELRTVSKNTAIAFALALKLSPDDADALLRSAGHALSDFLLEDMIIRACIGTGIYEVGKVNEILVAHGSKPLPRCRA